MSGPRSQSFAVYPSLKDTPVIVTGGASGIGMEIVRAFAGQGSRVGVLDFDAEHGEALATELRAAGHVVRFENCDLRDTRRCGAQCRRWQTRTDRHACWSTMPRATTVTAGRR